MTKSKTNSSFIETAERRAFVLRMKKAGANYRQIASAAITWFGKKRVEEMGLSEAIRHYGGRTVEQTVELAGIDVLPKGWDERYAYKDVKRTLDQLRADNYETAQDIRDVQLMRLEDLVRSLWPKATGADPSLPVVDRLIRIFERQAKLAGTDSPAKIAPTDPTGEREFESNIIHIYETTDEGA